MPLQSHASLEALLAVANTAHGHEGHAPLPAGTDPEHSQTHDHLESAAAAREFLQRREIALPRGVPDGGDLGRMRALRAAVFALSHAQVDEFRRVSAPLLSRTRFRVKHDGELRADATGWSGFVGDLVLTLVAAADLIGKMRTCANPECQWVYVDRSKNQKRRWCERETCGNRMNLRSWRARQRQQHNARGRRA
jgi:hypothetical protein